MESCEVAVAPYICRMLFCSLHFVLNSCSCKQQAPLACIPLFDAVAEQNQTLAVDTVPCCALLKSHHKSACTCQPVASLDLAQTIPQAAASLQSVEAHPKTLCPGRTLYSITKSLVD